MADKMYAFSTIRYGAEKDESGYITGYKEIGIGEPVSQSDIEATDDGWAQLVESGAVRPYEYPDVGDDESPADYYKRVAREATEAAAAGEPISDELQNALKVMQSQHNEPGIVEDASSKDAPVAAKKAGGGSDTTSS